MSLNSIFWMAMICLVSIVASLFLYFFCRKKEELSKNATYNTYATIAVIAANATLGFYFIADLNTYLQGIYDSLSIPTISSDYWVGTPLWAEIIIGLVARDFLLYVVHRWMHTRWGWATHAGHHSDSHVNALTVFRIHPFEDIAMHVFSLVLLTWMQLPQTIVPVYLATIAYGMYIHMDLDIDHGPFKYVFASPLFHRWHHADVPAAYGKNLSNFFPIFDVIGGTFYLPGKCDAPMGALKSGVEDKNLIAIMTFPFRNWAQEIKISWRTLRAHSNQPDRDVAEHDALNNNQ